jgi:FixJ family two-component response regulator
MTTVGYNAAPFARPAEFLAKYDPHQHGCLVLDVRMPEARSIAHLVKMHLMLSGQS